MPLKTLKLAADLRESIEYDANALPFVAFAGSFDDYVDREWGCHWHDEFEIILVQKGSLTCTTHEGLGNPSPVRLMAGDAVLINSGVLHSVKANEADTVGRGFALPMSFFDFRPLANVGARILQPIVESGMPHILFAGGDRNSEALIAAIDELCVGEGETSSRELRCVELICGIWRLFSEHVLAMRHSAPPAKQSAAERRVKQMVSFIHEHFYERIAAEDLAKHARISRTECFRCFNEVLKKTPAAYLNEYRLSTAAMLLTHSERNITEIALSCGFSDTSYFAKMFRRTYGASPKQYRNQMAGKR